MCIRDRVHVMHIIWCSSAVHHRCRAVAINNVFRAWTPMLRHRIHVSLCRRICRFLCEEDCRHSLWYRWVNAIRSHQPSDGVTDILSTMHRIWAVTHYHDIASQVIITRPSVDLPSTWVNEWNCNDLECVRKPTESRFSLTHCTNRSSRWAE